MEIHRSVSSDHRYPRSKRRSVAQCVQLSERVQENVLDQIVHLVTRHARQQNSMHQRSVHFIQAGETIALTIKHCFDQTYFKWLWSLGRSEWLTHQQHLRGCFSL